MYCPRVRRLGSVGRFGGWTRAAGLLGTISQVDSCAILSVSGLHDGHGDPGQGLSSSEEILAEERQVIAREHTVGVAR
jgi:hypothetical protein